MRVFKYKQIYGILMCVILLVFSALTIIQPGSSTVVVIYRPSQMSDSVPSTLFATNASSGGRQTNKNTTISATNVQVGCREFHENGDERRIFLHGRLLQHRSLYYCDIPQCGSTFMGVFLKKLLLYEFKGRRQNISDAFAFMFVREPYNRLFSAYENKLFHPNENWDQIGTPIVREIRKNASELSKRLGHDVTFVELIQYVVKLFKQGRKLEPHLAAMHTICNPCKQQFDYVGKLETITEDIVHLVDAWKTRGIISKETIPTEDIESETKYERSFGRVQHMFWTCGRHGQVLSKYKLFQRTWSSYQISGMILNAYKMPFDISNVSSIDMKLYTQAVKSAMDNGKGYENELKAQRKEALLQAYRTVPVELMNKLRSFVKTDCVMFGYDDKPEFLFNRSVPEKSTGHDYFKWL